MRIPPLPRASLDLTGDKAAKRAVGNRPANVTSPITIDAYNPEWPAMFAKEEAAIRAALGTRALAVEHVGSTAVPGLAAKNRLDIDLIVADPADEDAYVPPLEAAGYFLRTRDPDWYQHRCLWAHDHGVNLHVFGPDCDEYLRHLLLRDWLRDHPEDRDRYSAEKQRAAQEHPMDMALYVQGKSAIIIDILKRCGLR
ncbi:GrpB family protein [Micromonospora sp. MA102]|uniref:GrpB family protein n=1 Tax=Micromonospora sp. MA102 TaxID=2952755 RepID=UPI0021C9B18C|nr:GrpB family protein [Micromonospora sp. MA102]